MAKRPKEKPYERIRNLVEDAFPELLEKGSGMGEQSHPITDFETGDNLRLRNLGYVLLANADVRDCSRAVRDARCSAYINRLRQIRDLIKDGLGYEPTVETEKVKTGWDGVLPIEGEHLTYDIKVGTVKILHKVGRKEKEVESLDLFDRVHIAFRVYDLD